MGTDDAVRIFPRPEELHDGILRPRGCSTEADETEQRTGTHRDELGTWLRPTGAFVFRAVRETLRCHRIAAYASPGVEPGETDRSAMF